MGKELITPLLIPLMEKSGGSVVVEAGHFYTKHGVDEQALAGVCVAANLVELMIGFFETTPNQMLLLDDIGEKIEPFMIQAAVDNFINLGFIPDSVIFESQLVEQGRMAIVDLQTRGLTKDHKGRKRLKQGWVPLQGKAGIADHPACEVMDAVLYQQKLSQWGGAMTILPDGYQAQQQKTKIIFQAITGIKKPNAVIIYHNRKAQITDTDYWGER